MDKIYEINWNTLAELLTPQKLRKNPLTAFLQSILYPVALLHNALLGYRKAKAYELKINYQVCYLESFLNDRFDFIERRIRIVDTVWKMSRYLYLQEENKPLFIYQASENKPVYLYRSEETVGDTLNDFVIEIPVGVAFQEPEIRAMIATNLSGKRYKIEVV